LLEIVKNRLKYYGYENVDSLDFKTLEFDEFNLIFDLVYFMGSDMFLEQRNQNGISEEKAKEILNLIKQDVMNWRNMIEYIPESLLDQTNARHELMRTLANLDARNIKGLELEKILSTSISKSHESKKHRKKSKSKSKNRRRNKGKPRMWL